MRRLLRHSRRCSPAGLRFGCIAERLVTGRSAIHYLRGNRLRRTTITWLGQSQIMGAVMRIWKMTHAELRYLSSNRFASGSERSYGRHQPKEAVMTNVVPMSRPPGVVISNGAITGAGDQRG